MIENFWIGKIYLYAITYVLLYSFPFTSAFENLKFKAYLIILLGIMSFIILVINYRRLLNLLKTNVFFQMMIVFFMIILLSTVLAFNPPRALVGTESNRLGFLALASFVFIGLVVYKKIDLKILRIFYINIIISCLLALFLEIRYVLDGNRMVGFCLQPNTLSVICGIGIIIGMNIPLGTGRFSLHKRLLGIFSLVGVILLTQSRGGLILVAGIMLLTFCSSPVYLKLKTYSKRHMTQLLILLLIVVSLLTPLIAKRVVNYSYFKESISYRIDLLEYGTGLVQHMPVFGWGLESTAELLPVFSEPPESIQDTYAENVITTSTHNFLMDKLIDFGWFGLGLYLTLIGMALNYFRVNYNDSRVRILGLIILLITLHNLGNRQFFETDFILLLSVISLGLCSNFYSLPSKRSN